MPDDAPPPPPVTAVLMAASKHIAVTCAGPSAAFIECKKKDKDPAACLAAGDAVTACVASL
jgi:NADH dehydrogenase (ubiquinone) 1 alpha subcomplex subunit 8